jgi:hypothetical protein
VEGQLHTSFIMYYMEMSVEVHALPLYFWGKNHCDPSSGRLGGPQKQSGCFEETNLQLLSGIKEQFLQCPVQGLVHTKCT